MISNQRSLFDLPADVAYLNCAYMGPLPRASREAGEAAVARKSRPWEIPPADFFEPAERTRGLFAQLIGAAAGEIALVPSASYGLAVAAANLRLEAGEAILVLAEQFPSNVYVWREKAAEAGADIVTVARPENDDWTGAVLERLEPRVKIVALPHCHWTDGGLLDLALIAAAARRNGAAVVIDGTQSLGALPFDVRAIQPDFVAAAAYKWLLGPYSAGFLYVAPRHHEGKPIEHNWVVRAGAEDFTGLVEYRDDFAPGARRFDQGERAGMQLLPMSIASLELLLGWGVAEIQATLAEKTAAIAAGAAELGIGSAPASRRAGHFAGLRFPGGIPHGLPEKLAAAKVYVSVRGSSLRVTPHLYNSDEDVARLLEVLRATRG
jgi:selenocysteine lyase/cysteine desulfurase